MVGIPRELPVETTTGLKTPVMEEPPAARVPLVLRLDDGREARLARTLSVGQSSVNDLVIRDDHVSRRHCRIEVGARVIVRDLGSTNGTWVNGLRVQQAELRAGTVLAVGGARMRVAVEGEQESPLLGESVPMRRLRGEIARYGPTGLSLLINGETGTGKELVARAIHEASGRRGRFVAVNCGSIPKELVESELFGHERGAFTGALARRAGLFEEADGGTLFLDEVGELPETLQPRLLRVLETGVVRPVGASRELTVDVRVVAATHVDLPGAVADGRFRRDLYFRLAHGILRVPPLRARGDDIALLAGRFLDELACEHGVSRLSEAALEALKVHRWPGNVRELKNVLRRAAVLGGPTIEPHHLQLDRTPVLDPAREVLRLDGRAYTDLEREIYERALRLHRGNRRRAAQALRIPKSTFCDKVRRYGLEFSDDP